MAAALRFRGQEAGEVRKAAPSHQDFGPRALDPTLPDLWEPRRTKGPGLGKTQTLFLRLMEKSIHADPPLTHWNERDLFGCMRIFNDRTCTAGGYADFTAVFVRAPSPA